MCINVANEQLLYFYNQHVFAWQQKVWTASSCHRPGPASGYTLIPVSPSASAL